VRRSLRFPTSGPVGSRHPFRLGLSAVAARSAPLQGDLRFFRPRLPSAPSPSLAVGLPPRWGASGLPSCRSRRIRIGSVGVCAPVGVLDVVVLIRRRAIRPTYLLVTACQPFWPFRSHEALATLHLRSTFRSFPSPPPPQGWQRSDRCPRSFARRITPSHVRVGTPGHHRVRWVVLLPPYTKLLDRPCGRMHNVYIHPLVAPRVAGDSRLSPAP
jgi:hypothetical protein